MLLLEGFGLILFGLNEFTTTIAGVGLLTVIFCPFVIKTIIENIGFNSNSILGEILSNFLQEPVNKVLNLGSKIFSKLQF